MDEKTRKLLTDENADNPFHSALLAKCRTLVRMSRSAMSKYYEDWDTQDQVYRGEMAPDKEDVKNSRAGKPVKMVVPNTRAQVQTFVAFLFLLLKQNNTFFTLQPTGNEDRGTKQSDSEALLERDLRYNEWNTKLYQFLLDIPRFGLGILETSWTKDVTNAYIVPEPQQVMGPSGIPSTFQAPPGYQEFTRFEGNLLRNVSPYRFFPDTRMPLVDFQDGEFCADECDYSMTELRRLEAGGEIAGVDLIQPLGRNATSADVLGGSFRGNLANNPSSWATFDTNSGASVALVTRVQIWIVPSKFKTGPGEADVLGAENFPVLYHCWYANNNRLIRCEPARWWHNKFSYSLAQYSPDMQQQVNFGLADLIYRLQEVISWYVNSHIRSVNRVIGNRLIVDPKIVETKTLDGDGDIYIKKGMSVPLERAVGQLRTQDVTGSHMADADIVSKIIEVVTGVNSQMQGQYSAGRRSATQERAVQGGAAGRMKMHGHLIWESGFGQQGQFMLSNLRQSLSIEMFVRAIGMPEPQKGGVDPMTGQPMMIPPEEVLARRFAAFKGTPAEVICGGDYMMFDSTLDSDKVFAAQSIQELLVAIMGNPMAGQQLDLSAKALLEGLWQARGLGDVKQFSMSSRIRQGLESPPPPMVDPNAQPQQPGGPQLTHSPNQSTTTTTHAPVIHIHHAKPSNGNGKPATPSRS